jgi:hypothetical protein
MIEVRAHLLLHRSALQPGGLRQLKQIADGGENVYLRHQRIANLAAP